MEAQKNKGGRPMKYKSAKALQEAIDTYFDETPLYSRTITGLALSLGMTTETLRQYQQKERFSAAIKEAKTKIEHAYELHGMEYRSAFDIFRLKNMGWTDKQEIESTVTADVTTRQSELPEHLKELISGIADES